jgi:hypothetical protein
MSYTGLNLSKNQSFTKNGASQQMAKSNVTLWKSKYNQGIVEEDKKVEDDYIENLKKQIYFMEMELKLMKEREKEVEKSGGFTQLFNDDRDPSQHILQLKQKYTLMRKNMENKLEDLNNKKREVQGQNVSLKAKLQSLKSVEKEVYLKLVNLEEKSNAKLIGLENDFLNKNRERLEIEANNRLAEVELKNENLRNQELEYTIKSAEKLEQMKQEEFEKNLQIIENMTKEKIKAYEIVNEKIKELNSKTSEEPYFKTEMEKNAEYKKKIESIEKEILDINTHVESLDIVNEYLIKKKETVINERKKLINLNDELKREIEAKTQLNEIRIQKKVKENNSEDISKLEAHLQGVINNITELEGKISTEVEKIRVFSTDIIRLNIDLRHKEERRETVIESVDTKLKELSELKDVLEKLKSQHNQIKDKVKNNLILILIYF